MEYGKEKVQTTNLDQSGAMKVVAGTKILLPETAVRVRFPLPAFFISPTRAIVAYPS